jgi:hypothetical protein
MMLLSIKRLDFFRVPRSCSSSTDIINSKNAVPFWPEHHLTPFKTALRKNKSLENADKCRR